MKKKIHFFKIFYLVCYIACVIVLIVESCMSGAASANQSNALGGTIANIFNDINGDQTVAVKPTSISIKDKISTAFIGEKYQITVTTSPEDATYKELAYKTDNRKVATVSNDGVISFLDEGIVTIEAYNTVYPSLKDSMTIEVKEVVATGISSLISDAVYNSTDDYYTLYIGKTYNIKTTFEPSNTTYKELSYSLSDSSYLKVNNDGSVTPSKYSSGKLTEITISHKEFTNTIKVCVDYENIEHLSSISAKDLSVVVTESAGMQLTFTPANATFKDYTISTSDKSVAAVSGNKIVGKKAGTSTIDIVSKTYPDIKTTCQVTVNEQPKMTSYSASISDTMTVGSSKTVSITNIVPKYANVSNKKFESSNNLVASVNSSGKVTANGVGSCVINVKIDDIAYDLPITVVNKLDEETTGFDVSIHDLLKTEVMDITIAHGYVGETYTLNVDEHSLITVDKWYPKTPDIKTLTYELSDSTYGSISGNKLTILKPGIVDLNIYHSASGTMQTIPMRLAYDFDIVNLLQEEINLLNVNVKDIAYFFIKDKQNPNDIHQTYDVAIENYEIAALDKTENTFNIHGLSEGQTKVTITPYVDDEVFGCYTKELIIQSNHVVSTGISVFYTNNATGNFAQVTEDTITMSILNDYTLDIRHSNIPTTSSVKYTSKNIDIIEIDNDGHIIPKKACTGVVTVTEEKANISKDITINVLNYIKLNEENSFTIEGVELKYDENTKVYSILNGYSGSFKLNFDESSTYTEVTYGSSNEEVATIGKDGTITPLKVGVTEITAVCDDGTLEPIKYTITLEIKRQDFIRDLGAFFRFIRKGLGHFGAFLVLGIFSTLTWLSFMNRKKIIAAIPINFASGFFVAALTEYLQSKVPNRGPSFADVELDFSGFLCSAIVITIVMIIYEIVRFAVNKNRKKVVIETPTNENIIQETIVENEIKTDMCEPIEEIKPVEKQKKEIIIEKKVVNEMPKKRGRIKGKKLTKKERKRIKAYKH